MRPRCTDAVAVARDRGGAVVALESSVLSQGLEQPFNRQAAARMINAANPSVGAVGQKLIGSANNPMLRAGVTEASP